jgi:hypothetical protein
MSNPPNEPPRFVTCRCQNCSKGIEFDASHAGATVACPHCELETMLFIPEIPMGISVEKKKRNPFATFKIIFRFWRETKWLQVFATSRFERVVFTIIRVFALFWAALMVLALITATVNYLRGFPDRNKEPDANQTSFWEHISQSSAWQNFGIYMIAIFFILFILTIISFVLLLLAIERNTRRKD